MDQILETLWKTYQIENPRELDAEEKRLSEALAGYEDVLRADLNNAQKEMLEDYETCLSELNNHFEKEAFMNGIRFATAYLLEALS